MKYFYLRNLLVCFVVLYAIVNNMQAQCFTPPSYCTAISATNVGGYGMGIQNVTLNTAAIPVQINNTTSPGSGSPIYFDYTSQILTATSGATVNYSIRGGTSNQTKIRLFIDFDNNGTFNTTPIATAGGELVLDLANMTTPNTVVSGTFTLPTLSAGIYRIRVASDGQGLIPPPCGPSFYSADYEDYTLMVASSTADAIVAGIIQPTVLAASPTVNSASFMVRNLTNVNMTSISAGYTVNGGAATTQTFTGLSIAPGATYTVNFSTGFTAPTLGNYALRYFLYNVNGTTTQNTPLNDTICQTIPLLCTGPLSGAYTIDPAGGFTSTNFTSFTNAVNALRACGISGPVNFSVAAGTYTDTLYIPNITGVSATNTITFDGGNGNKATRILTYPTTSTANAVVRFNNSRYVTVRNMTLRSTGTGQGWVVHCMNDSNDRVNNCNIEFTGAATTSSSTAFSGLVINNSLTTISTTSANCRNIIIDSNLFNSGYYNIYTAVNANTFSNTFNYNNFTNALYNGIQLTGNQGAQVRFNQFSLRSTNTSGIGIYVNGVSPSGTNLLDLSSNQFSYCGQYGIYIINSNPVTTSSLVANNLITGFANTSGNFGIAANSSSRFRIYHNSVLIPFNATSGTSAGVHLINTNNVDIRNNILSTSGLSSINTYPFFASATSSFSALNYNNYYNLSSPILAQIAGVNLTAANYKTAVPANAGANSISENPGFISSIDLHTTNPCFNGVGGLSISQDIDGQTRAGVPDMGADEITGVPNNEVGIMSITTPNFPTTVGTSTVSIVVKNYGANTITSCSFGYRLGSGTPVTEAWTGSLAPCDTMTYTFTTSATISSGSTTFRAFSFNPNGLADPIVSNDTAQWTLCPALSGSYTINPSGSGPTNFTTFTAAVNSLICGGVSGPVTFNVSNGTYTEQLSLTPILGASAVNTITFQSLSGVAANCILSFSTPSSQAIIDLNGADYITFDKLTIRNAFTSTCYGIWIRNSAHFNTISNCIIDMNASGFNGYAVFQSNTSDNRNTINGNTINGAGYGVFLSSNTSLNSNRNIISNNSINGSYYYGIYTYYQDSVNISGNTITSSSAVNNYSGIYAYWSPRGPIITKNKIAFTSTSASSGSFYGLNLLFFNVNTFNPTRGLVANNMIQVGGTQSTAYGIYLQNSCNYSDIIHNSVNMTNSAANGSYALYMASGLSYDTVRNNIFQNIGNGTTSGYAAFVYSGTQMFYNNNDFFTRNSNFAAYNGTNYASYSAWKTAAVGGIPGFESAGVNREVSFVSSTDLHTTLPCIGDIGYNYSSSSPSITKVLDDIDGQARSTTPDLGCDEFTTSSFDVATQAMTSPSGSVFALATPYTVSVRVRNNGSTTITALDMNYSVNGGAVNSQSFTGLSLLPCDTAILTFTTSLTLTSSGSNVLRIFNGLINTSNADGNNTNDTLLINLCTPYSGTFSINKNLPFSTTNFTSVTQAVNSLYSCGISGPVVLRIDAGSGPYNEQVTLNGMISGLSRTNNLRISGNTTRETITFNPTVSTLQHTIRLITVKHITLDSLTINNTGTNFGVGVHLVTTADSNFVTNSNINIALANTSFSNSAGIAISTNTSNVTTAGNNGNNNIFNNNTIRGGYYGISAVGTSTTVFCKGNEVRNNRLIGQAFYGIYWYNQDSTKINGNTIDSMLVSNVNSYGMDLRFTQRFELERNKINRVGQFGIFLSNTNFQSGTGTARSEISNNMIGGIFYNSTPNGVYTQTEFRNIDFWHNTIHVVNQGTGYAFYMSQNSATTHSGLDFRNNTFSATNNSNPVGYFYYSNSNPFISFANNNIWGSISSSPHAYFSCSNYNTNTWILANVSSCISGLNTLSCRNLDPQFINGMTDLHTLQSALSNWGTNLAAVTTDIDGDTRPLAPSATVDVGADEYNMPADNSGVVAIISPSPPLTTGLQNVVVQIRNFGSSTLTTANVRYRVGVNGTVRTVAWTGSIATNGTSNVTFTTPNQHNFTGSFDTIIAWTDAPNGQPDGFAANDTVSSIVCSPLSGVYTIDTTLATGSGNFNSWAVALSSLINCGISGPVTINVTQPGTYVGAIDITTINGASALNTITFNGLNSANRILTATTSAGTPAVLRFNNCNFVTFRNFTIRTTDAANGWCAHFFNGTNNRVTNCILDIGGAGATSTNSNLVPVVMNGSLTSLGINSTTGNNHIVDSSALNAGFYSVYTSNSMGTSTYRFLNNTMNNAYQYGAYFNSSHAIKFNNNIVNMRGINASTYGLYIINNNPTTPNFHEINGNKFTNIGQFGIYFATSTNPSSTMGQVYNNMISGFKSTSTNVGIYNSSSSRWNIWHNSINLDFASTSGTNNCIYLQNGGTIDVRNNILSVTSPTIVNATPLFISATSAASALNNNLYYNASSANLISGAINATTTNFKLAFPSGGGLGSVNADPRFVNNATDLHTLNGCYTGANLGLAVDIDNQARGSAPDIGADETGPVLNNDMGIMSLNSPAFPLVAGSTSVNVTLRNFGANTVSTVTVSYRVNGGALTSQTLTGLSLAPCDTMNFTFSTPFTVTGATNISVFTSNPNGVTDTYFNNDTINSSMCVAMSGVYTIGSSGDFTTFAQAITQLSCAGVSGPVTFNVLSGTYTEQISIGEILGASATNTITFDGGAGNASTRILTFAGSAANPHTFRLNGSQFINVRNLTIRSTDGTNGWPVSIVDAKNCIVSNCTIEVAGAGATSTASNLAAVVLNGSRTAMNTVSSAIHNVYIDSNRIRNGYYGIFVNGNLVNTNYAYTSSNIIDSAYLYGIYSNQMTHKCNNNRIYMRINSAPAGSSGIFIPSNYTQTPDFSTYNYNQIYNARQYGIYMNNFYSNAGINQQVNNNVIGQFQGTGVTYGIYSGYSTNNEYYHNTINLNNAATGASRAMYIHSQSSVFVRNNIFAITNASAATTSIPVQFNASGVSSLTNNCYFNAVSTNIIQTTSGTFTTGAVTTAFPSGGGAGSITTNPQFPATDNLRLGAAVSAATFNSTVSISTLPFDMDNNPRNPPLGTTTPDMGAYDKTTSNVGVSAIISPTSVTAGSTHAITVRIRNYGTDAVSNIPLNYVLNGGTVVTETYTPTLNGNDSVSYTFTATATFTGCNILRCYTTLSGETYTANDTTTRNIGASIAGVYTIDPSVVGATNFTSFTNAVAFLNCGLVTGPVTFQVAAATYNEQVSIPSTIMGVSSTNTITFDGGSGNAATRILSFATGASGSGLSHVLRFNNCSFITFRNMTIRSSGTSEAWTVHFMNGTNNRIVNCIVDMTGNGTTSASTNYSSIVINGSTTSRTTSSTIANNHRVDSCTINFGYYGIFTALNNGALTNFFTNNTFANVYFSGGWFQNPQTVKFNRNTINTRTTITNTWPIYFTSANPSGSNFNEVNGNTIVRTGIYGIYFINTQGGTSNQGQCYNNFINGMASTSPTVGIFLNSASNWNLYHNTVNHDINSTSGPNYGMQIQNGSNNDVRNNILSTTIPTAVNWTPLFITPSGAASGVNSNNYWNPSSANLVNIGGVNYTASNFAAAYPSGGGLNSINRNPFYVSSSNIHVTSVCNNGENLGIAVDIDGDTRSSTPDMGADEVTTPFIVSYTSTPAFTSTGGGVDTIAVSSGSSVVLSGTGATSYSWSGPQSITNAVSFSATTSGEYTVTGTASGCTGTKKVFVKVTSSADLVLGTGAQNGVKQTRRGVSGSLIYYGDGVNYYFAIDTSGITSGALTGDTVIINVQTTIDSFKSSNGANQEHAMYLMPRFWDAKGSFTGTVKVRFPYLPSDTTLILGFRDSAWSRLKNITNVNTLAVKTPYIEWFKTVGVPYNASFISGIVGNKFPSTIVKPTVTYGTTAGGVHYVELGGITSFSGGGAGVGFGPGGGGGGVGLPVTWAGFEVQTLETGNNLIWKTASEQNTDYFEVEYSYDAKDFQVASDKIPAAGNSASLNTYSFIHSDFNSFTYYRIKQVDMDGQFDYSEIKLAKRAKGKEFQVSVFPTQIPENGQLTIEAKNIDKSKLSLVIMDVSGKFVYSNSYTPTANSLRELIELNQLQSGVYLIEISNGQGREVVKIVK